MSESQHSAQRASSTVAEATRNSGQHERVAELTARGRLYDVPHRDLPPGALAAAGFSALFSNHIRLWRQPHKKALVTNDTDLASPTRLTWKLCVHKPGSRSVCRAVPRRDPLPGPQRPRASRF